MDMEADGRLVSSWQMGGGGPGLVRAGTGGGAPAGLAWPPAVEPATHTQVCDAASMLPASAVRRVALGTHGQSRGGLTCAVRGVPSQEELRRGGRRERRQQCGLRMSQQLHEGSGRLLLGGQRHTSRSAGPASR